MSTKRGCYRSHHRTAHHHVGDTGGALFGCPVPGAPGGAPLSWGVIAMSRSPQFSHRHLDEVSSCSRWCSRATRGGWGLEGSLRDRQKLSSPQGWRGVSAHDMVGDGKVSQATDWPLDLEPWMCGGWGQGSPGKLSSSQAGRQGRHPRQPSWLPWGQQ